VFDNPLPGYGPETGVIKNCDVPFESRYAFVVHSVTTNNVVLIIAPRLMCKNTYFMHKYALEIIKHGGEGVIMRKPNSLYEHGRSQSLLKHKTVRDGEALVLYTQGLYCSCKLPTGIRFFAKVNTFNQISKGDVITFKCTSISSNGIPKQATVLRKRFDILWEHVLLNCNSELNMKKN